MRFRFGRGLTLLRGGNSGTSKIGEEVAYITGLEERLRKMEFGGMLARNGGFTLGCSLKSHPGRSGRGGTASKG